MLANTQVFFDNVPAPMIFAVSGQIGAVVPYSVAGRPSTQVLVAYRGQVTNVITLPVAETAPALFTLSSTGRGQGAILNQNGGVNSRSNPADRGSFVALYATGEGQTDPPGVDGQLAIDTLPKPRQDVSVKIGGLDAEVVYAGAAPSLVAGAMQVNVQVPQGSNPGDAVPIVLAVGRTVSQPGVTIAVR